MLSFCSKLNAQQGSKIKLRNVSVSDARLPTIFLYGKEYTARAKKYTFKRNLEFRFYDQNLRWSSF